MKPKLIIILFCLVLMFNSCAKTGNKKKDERKNNNVQNLSILIPIYMEQPIKEWTYFLQASHPNVKFEIICMNEQYFSSDTTFRDFDLIFTPSFIRGNKYKYSIISQEAIVCVVSFKNPFLQSIINRGISPNDLKKIFSNPNSYYWKDFFKTDKKLNDKITIILPDDRYTLINQLFDWLDIDKPTSVTMKSTDSILDLLKIQNDIMTFLPSSLVYNINTQYRKDFLYVVPIDLNNDNWISDDEYLYDNIIMIKKAVLDNKIDSLLVLQYKLIYSIDNSRKNLIEDIVNNKHNLNKNIFEQYGYFVN